MPDTDLDHATYLMALLEIAEQRARGELSLEEAREAGHRLAAELAKHGED